MQEILTQEEIDALLNSLSSGNVSAEQIKQEQTPETKKIRTYDFRRPNRFSKEQIRTLEMMHENFARLLSTFLSAYLRTVVEVKLLSVQELSYDEFIRSVPNPTVLVVVRIEELGGEMLLELNPTLAFSIIERLLGGKGGSKEEHRALTEIEQTIILRLTGQIVRVLGEAWHHVVPLRGSIERLESNPQFVQLIAGSEMVALVSLEIRANGAQGFLNLCFPYILLKPVTGRLSARYWFSKSERQEQPSEGLKVLQHHITKAFVPVVVEIGRANITARDLLYLQVGDVIPLESKVTEEVDVLVGNRPKFRGRPGLVGNRLAVKITALRREGEEGNG